MNARVSSLFLYLLTALVFAGLLLSWSSNDLWWGIFETAVLGMAGLWGALLALGVVGFHWDWSLAVFPAILAWGALQRALGWTGYAYATRMDMLRWAAYGAISFLAIQGVRGAGSARPFRRVVGILCGALVLFSLVQYYLLGKKVFGVYTLTETYSGFGPFLNADHFGLFVCITMCLAAPYLNKQRTRWVATLGLTLLFAAAVTTGSRAAIGLAVLVCAATLIRSRASAGFGLLFAGLTVVFAGVLGWQTFVGKLAESGQAYGGRREVALASLSMIHERLWTGWGLGTWTAVYPSHALKDFGVFVNAAHNDWLQWASDGGVPMFALMAALFGLGIAAARRSSWALAAVIPFVHSLVDFPMQGKFLPALVFLLYGAARAERRRGSRGSDE